MLSLIIGAVVIFGVAAASAGPLPNLNLTPGVARTELTVHQICTTKWGKDARAVTAAMKRQVFQEYGLTGNSDPFCRPKGCEIDHAISRELGGADDVKNLWPQSYSGPWNAHMKDRVENRLHKEVCAGTISLDAARAGIVHDWTAIYRQYFGAAN
ncbi:MAG TPA: HNH endonuclease signature motif containing protein [Rhizomicrobium sp.]|jgi:hypothetical protein